MRSPILLSHHPFRLGETLSKASPSVSQSPLGLSFMPMNSVPTELCWGSTWSPLGKGCPAQDLCPWAPKSALPMLHIRAASPPPPPPHPEPGASLVPCRKTETGSMLPTSEGVGMDPLPLLPSLPSALPLPCPPKGLST